MTVQEPSFIKPNYQIKHLPGNDGLPIIGSVIPMLNSPLEYLQSLHEQYGNIIRLRLLANRRAVLLDASLTQAVFMDKEKNFSSYLGWNRLFGELLPGGLVTRDFADHRNHRHAIQPLFGQLYMQGYFERMSTIVQEELSKWKNTSPLVLHDMIKVLTLHISLSILCGIKSIEDAQVMSDLFRKVVDPVSGKRIVRHSFYGNAMWKGLKARKLLQNYFLEKVPSKRGTSEGDVFSTLCSIAEINNVPMRDEEIVDHILFIMAAAHDTITSALTNIVYYLIKYPKIQETLRDELRSIHQKNLNFDDLNSMPYTEQIFNETLRLHPPIPFILRRTLEQCAIDNHVVPENVETMLCPMFLHRDKNHWDNPNDFIADRFSAGNKEKIKHPFSFCPFGGGAHKCLGMHYAMMEAKVILFYLLSNFKIENESNLPDISKYYPLPQPKGKWEVKVTSIH